MEPIPFQVTVDCGDPHSQARFWAEALGYDREDHSRMVRSLLDARVATPADVVESDGGLAWRTAAAIRHPNDPPLGSPGSHLARRVLFQLVDEPKTVKNRWHLDLNVGREQIDAEVERMKSLGAKELYRIDAPGEFHTTMADLEGNEFCVQ